MPRLHPKQLQSIQEQAALCFGNTVRVWLFGSRADEQQAGGDIDLYIETEEQNPTALLDAKLLFLKNLHKQFGEQKIDVVLQRALPEKENAIALVAKQRGVRLL
jgi:predicted nucleotidyltransferase